VCSILGRISDAREEVCDDADVVHSARIVVLCAIQELLIVSLCLHFVAKLDGLEQRSRWS
jgi:hypothetical protein